MADTSKPAESPKPSVKLPSLKVRTDEKIELWIALDVRRSGWIVPRLSLTPEEAKNEAEFPKIRATFARWTWPTKSFMQEQSWTEKDQSRQWSQQRWSENRLRYLLLDWTVPGDNGDPIKISRHAVSGRSQLTEPCFREVAMVQDSVLEAFLAQLTSVLEYGVDPATVNKPVLEGVVRDDLRASLTAFFADRGLASETAKAALAVLADGPLRDHLPPLAEEEASGNSETPPPTS